MNISMTDYNDTQHFFRLHSLILKKKKCDTSEPNIYFFDGKVLRKALYPGSLIDINYTIYKAVMNMN